jgi:antirestriction protein ArdC
MHENTETSIDVYALITNRIIELLKAGTIPWRKPWTDAGLPKNLVSKRPYRGINVMLLNSMGFERNFFLTWKQIQSMYASVKRGEKGTVIIFQKMVDVKKDGHPTGRKMSMLRYYTVFNVAQCNDIPRVFLPDVEANQNEPIWECERILEHMTDCPSIHHGGDEAYYLPSEDCINMPGINLFENIEAYYGILFHELIHSTGHEERVGRREVYENPAFGTDPYSMEELVAEMGACYLKSHAGLSIEKLNNNAAYIQSWLKVLEGDNRLVIQAASRAQKAVEYVLNLVAKTDGGEKSIIETHWD